MLAEVQFESVVYWRNRNDQLGDYEACWNRDARYRNDTLPEGAHILQADIHDEDQVAKLIEPLDFDIVADFIAFEPAHLERLSSIQRKTKQFIFISSASAYQTPLSDYRITEGTPLSNPYWAYSRNKIACEDYLMKQYREYGFHHRKA